MSATGLSDTVLSPEGLHMAAMCGVATEDEIAEAICSAELKKSDQTAMLIALLTRSGARASSAAHAIAACLNAQ